MKNHIKIIDDKLIITYPDYLQSDENDYENLMEFLGDNDIESANEIGDDYIVNNDNLYIFGATEQIMLSDFGSVTLECIGNLETINNKKHKNRTRFYERD